MYKELHRLVESASALGAARLAESLGITPGEISQRQALKTYGSWFAIALRDQRIQPARIEEGHAGTIYYRIADILRCKVEDRADAELINP